MRNKGWLRYSLASLTLVGAGLGAFLVACGDDDDNVTPKDGGADTGPGTGDSGGQDATPDQQNPPVDAGPPNAKLQLVNAATSFGPSNPSGALRVCYGVGPSEAQAPVATLPPLPDRKSSPAQPFPGVFIGTGGSVQGTGADLTSLAVVPYLMNAQSLAQRGLVKPDAGVGVSCADLFGAADAGGELIPGVDYWKLPAIPPNTLVKDKSFILVLTGCAGDANVTPTAKCGPDFAGAGNPGNGNLKVTVYEVDRKTAVAQDKIGTQFIHASAAGAAALGVGGIQVIPGYITDKNDPATFKAVSGTGGADGGAAVALAAKTDLMQVTGVNVASDSFIANPSAPNTAFTLQQIQQFSYGANVPDGGNYRNGASFTFIAVGDPGEPPLVNDQFNTKVFHFIALPNDPINEVYKP